MQIRELILKHDCDCVGLEVTFFSVNIFVPGVVLEKMLVGCLFIMAIIIDISLTVGPTEAKPSLRTKVLIICS